jgi:exopolysaccharide production protein ExoQ
MIAHGVLSSSSTAATPRWGLIALAVIFFGSLFFVRLHSFQKSIDVYSEDADAGEELEGGTRNTEKTAAFLLMAAAGAYCIIATSGARYELRWGLAGLLALHLSICLVSVLWSTNPSMTLRRDAMVVVCAIAAAGIGRQLGYRELVVFMVGLASSYAALGVFAEVALGTFKPWEADYRFAGTVHPNEQGMLCGAAFVGALLLAIEFRSFRLQLWSLAIAAAGGLLLSRSRTALISTVGSLALSMFLLMPLRYWPHVFTLGGFSLASLFAVAASIPPRLLGAAGEMLLLGRGEDASNLTGRLPVWEALVPHISDRFWLGFGYRAFWDRARVEEFRDYTGGWQVPDAHNSYLEMVLNVGIVGAAPLFLAMLLAMAIFARRAMKHFDIGTAFFAGLIFSLFIGGMTEATLFNNSMFSCLMATCAVARLTLHKNAFDRPLLPANESTSPAPLVTLETAQ